MLRECVPSRAGILPASESAPKFPKRGKLEACPTLGNWLVIHSFRACRKINFWVEQATGLSRRASNPPDFSAASCRQKRAGSPFHPFIRHALLFALFALCLVGSPGSTRGDLSKDELWKRLAPFFSPPASLANDLGSYSSPLKFYDGRPVRTNEEWLDRRQEILGKWTELMGAWPPVLERPRIEYLDQEKRENFVQHRVRLEIAANQFEEAYLLVPDGNGPFPAVVVPYYEPKSSIGKGQELRDFGYQLAKRGFVSLNIGSPGGTAREPVTGEAVCQPLSFLAYVAANCWNALANLPNVDRQRIGIVGHSYGGKWAMFASCLYEKFACAAWSDGGIVFDEARPNVNYWEPWYLGQDRNVKRKPGVPSPDNPRTGAYKRMIETGRDLHELHALMAPRPFLVSGGSEDRPQRWIALNHAVAVNQFLGHTNRVAMTNREGHTPTPESNEQIYLFFEYFLKHVEPNRR
ncbi:MAG: alpha/beta hydrolase [Verrucomicrobia bacterium]|nr:alpha/beta hydrolase [Verrucomicrobiota bacterium]